jgi:hypothetical protein|tara:strand:+ start:552 stop:974 length:423 start_codon:yes stop_codon:yes gene_type:complete
MEINMIANVIKELSKDKRVPSGESKDYGEFAYTVKECANLDSKIELVRVDNFAIARNNYGHVKYLNVVWSVDEDYVDSDDISEATMFEIQDLIYEKLYKKMHWDNSDLNVFINFEKPEKLEISGDYLIKGLVQEIYDYQP